MEERTRHRAAGAVVLLLAAAIVFPLVLESSPPGERVSDEPEPVQTPEESPDRIRITTFGGTDESLPPAGTEGAAEPPASLAELKPDEPVESSLVGGWAVQIGSFADPGNAEKLREQVAARGYRVVTQRARSADGKVRVRVLVGPDRTRAAAAAQRLQLRREDSIEGFLVRFSG